MKLFNARINKDLKLSLDSKVCFKYKRPKFLTQLVEI